MDNATLSPVVGLIVALATNYLRSAPWFTVVEEGDKKKAKALAGVLAAVASLVASYGTGNLDEANVGSLANYGVGFIQTLGMSSLFHHWFLKGGNKT